MSKSDSLEAPNKAVNRMFPPFEKKLNDKWAEPFYFVQAADTQLGLIMNYGDGTVEDQYPYVTWDKELELCRQAIEIINTLQPAPKFVVLCGDLLDAPPDQWPEVRKRQLHDFIQVFKALDPSIPMVSLCGNADLGNIPTKESIASYKSSFGDDYFSFWVGNVHFIVLNSQLFEDIPDIADSSLVQNKWLDEQLGLSKEHKIQHIVIFQHIPLFVHDPKEEKSYFNIEPKIRTELLDKFKKFGVSKIFCGHCHENAGGWDDTLELIVTTAIGCQLGKDVHGMRIVKIFEGEIQHEFHGFNDFPRKIDLTPPKD